MELIARFLDRNLVALAVLLFLVQVLVRELGFWIGSSHAGRAASEAEGTGVLVGAMLALLTFVLALSLAFASARFDERRAGTLAEANAVSTAWLRAKAIDQERGERIARLLEDYAGLRAAFVRSTNQRRAIEDINARTAAVQSEIWANVAALAREQPNALAVSLMAAVNETFDAATAERFAYDFQPPRQLFWLLVGMTLIAMGVLGFQLGLRQRPLRVLSILLAAMWTLVTTDIIDLGAARLGAIRTDARVYDWAIAGFRHGVSIPATHVRE